RGGPPTTLYARREHIQIRHIKGYFQVVRDLMMTATMALYFVLPWINYRGSQSVLFDLPNRRFDIFGFSFWPQDFLFLAWALMLAAFALFFFTVLAGRVFCGYVCPQTNWTRLFTQIERWCEGDRHQRMRRSREGLTFDTAVRRTAKHSLWLAVGVATGVTFVGYFYPIRELVPDLVAFDANGWAVFWIGMFTVATYGNAGFMREQVCLYMCPYARFQSVMFDEDTLIVSYDEARGEPRGKGLHRKTAAPDVPAPATAVPLATDAMAATTAKAAQKASQGDCIDCELCVQVCPTGIDIREGLQLGCITCAACIDACDEVMEKVNRPKGLIRYTTEHALGGIKTKMMRPRLIGYGLVMALLSGLFVWQLAARQPLQVDVIRDRNQLYRITSQGDVENSYRLEILNKDQDNHRFVITLIGDEALSLVNGPVEVSLASGEQRSVPVTVSYDPYLSEPQSPTIWFLVRDKDDSGLEIRHESRFIKPR
ncbi:RdxA/RdxB/FixG family protein, partial [Isoalcanivorax beigongshangi]|uniref:RdxA/RdxB/FixG family protein n=1 Tax=Isoalcanivorax beigongshangi TaxID=3238810 RepID=UPI003F713C32